uniref:Putative secreted protein n=1 Tax=Anopheles darlingi TaxID=43151 RepID=A0A2M4DNC6_ANODA
MLCCAVLCYSAVSLSAGAPWSRDWTIKILSLPPRTDNHSGHSTNGRPLMPCQLFQCSLSLSLSLPSTPLKVVGHGV